MTSSSKNKKQFYRSGLESKVAEAAPRGLLQYEPWKVDYVEHHTYLPDFVNEAAKVLVECKGFFRVGDTLKYKSIRDSVAGWELVFVLSDGNKKVRKGSKMTMGQWCEKEGFKWCTLDTLDKLIKYVEGRSNDTDVL